jgi:hypothetical protein
MTHAEIAIFWSYFNKIRFYCCAAAKEVSSTERHTLVEVNPVASHLDMFSQVFFPIVLEQ